MRLVVSGGGSGGHVTPVLATIDALRRLDSQLEVLYIGGNGLEGEVATAAGLEFVAIKSGKLRRAHGAGVLGQLRNPGDLLRNTRDVGRLVRGYSQALRHLRRYKPDVVFAKGGHVSLPVGLAARTLRIPYVIHDSDVIPGLTSRQLASGASIIATGWPIEHYTKLWPKEKLHYTGIPVRSDLAGQHRLAGALHFGFNPKLPIIVVTGGGQGARALNNLIVELAPRLTEHSQVILACGEKEIDRVRFALSRQTLKHPERLVAQAYLMEDYGLALAAGDIAITRAGATTIAELALLKKPTILIPNQVMAGHQVANGQLLSRAGAAVVLKEDKLSAGRLAAEIEQLLGSESQQKALSAAIAGFAVPDAAERLATLIRDLAPAEDEEEAEA